MLKAKIANQKRVIKGLKKNISDPKLASNATSVNDENIEILKSIRVASYN